MADLRRSSGGAQRAAETLLRGTGGRAVRLRVPVPAAAGDVTEQIGLSEPAFQDVELAPVVFRRARPQMEGGVPQWELLLSAINVNSVVGSMASSSASVLFAQASGVVVDDTLMEVVSVTSSDAGGEPYLYRLTLRAPAVQAV